MSERDHKFYTDIDDPNYEPPKTLNPSKVFEFGPLERLISGCVRDCINNHGDIRTKNIGSAAKRIAGSLRGALKDCYDKDLAPAIAIQYEKDLLAKIERLEDQNYSLRKQRNDLLEFNRNLEPLPLNK